MKGGGARRSRGGGGQGAGDRGRETGDAPSGSEILRVGERRVAGDGRAGGGEGEDEV
jgi:hypothetical protein